ncbi:MAG: ABC transporter substrate-binding protein [Aeromicrobium sp.]|nr:ABC transporter substrate-binding protein [Burkholderiales bacterium]
MIIKSFRITALMLALGLTVANVQSQAAVPETIKIGVSGPFTGGSKPMGESMRNGIRLAVEEINSIGGVNGKLIELIERDDEAKVDVGARVAKELTENKVVATIGIVNTGVGLASIGAYQKARIPLVIAVSTGTSLTKTFAPPAAPQNFIFRVAPTLDLEATVLMSDIARGQLTQVAILADSTAYGDAGLAASIQKAKSAGISLVDAGRFNLGDTDMTAQLRSARDAGAQAIVVWGIGPELAAIAKNKAALKWRVPMLGSWAFSMRTFIDGAGSSGEGAIMPQTFIQEMGSAAKNSFLLAYNRSFKQSEIPSPMSAAQGYDGMHLLYKAIRQARTTDGVKIKEALENLKIRYQGAITSYNKPFSATDHDAITTNMLVMGKIKEGRVDYAYVDDERRGSLLRLKAK